MMKAITSIIGALTPILVVLVIIFATLGAWVQHFITTVSDGLWVLLVIGTIIPPVGVLHGWLIWFGAL